jgi:hypothetical protein
MLQSVSRSRVAHATATLLQISNSDPDVVLRDDYHPRRGALRRAAANAITEGGRQTIPVCSIGTAAEEMQHVA